MNKRLYFLWGLSMLASLSFLHAQQDDYLEDGKVWSMLSVSGPARWTYTVSVFGEVERCGHIWKHSRTDEQEFLLLRQEDKKIWAMCPYDNVGMDTVPFLMFDFGLKKGDTAHLYVDTVHHRDDVWIVEDVFDSVFEYGQESKHCQRVYFMKYPEIEDIWVEGIGSLANGLTYSPIGFLRGPSELICVQKATGDIVYHNKKYHSCYIPDTEDFFPEGKTWSVIATSFFAGPEIGYVFGAMHMRVEGETDTLGFVWKRIVNDDGYPSLYRQEGYKIYGYNELDSIYLRFDFGLQKGDTVLTYTFIPDYYVVDSIFESTFGQTPQKRKYLEVHSLRRSNLRDIWVEGIGSLSAGMIYYHSSWAGGKPSLLCVEENGKTIYQDTQYRTCHVPDYLSYDYSIQNWSVLCSAPDDTRHTELLYFKESGRKQWNQAYRATQEDFSSEKPLGWYYQDMLQVYFKEKEADTAILLYDFGLEKGERFLNENREMWAVDSVYYEKIDGLERRCQRMVSENGEVDIWVEGIGSLKTGFFPADFFDEHSATELLCVQADVFWHRNYMYHNARYNTCYIGKETSVKQDARTDIGIRYDASAQTLVIEGDVKIDRIEVMDVRGRCVLHETHPTGSVSVAHLPRGLYLYRLTAPATTQSGKFVR